MPYNHTKNIFCKFRLMKIENCLVRSPLGNYRTCNVICQTSSQTKIWTYCCPPTRTRERPGVQSFNINSVNLLTPNDTYSGRTAPLTSKRCILYIYSTNIGTEYFKHGIYSPFFSLRNAVCFIILSYLVPVLFTFYIQGVLKFKKIIPAPRG